MTSTSLTNTFNVPLPKLGELKSKSSSKSSPEPTITFSDKIVEIYGAEAPPPVPFPPFSLM